MKVLAHFAQYTTQDRSELLYQRRYVKREGGDAAVEFSLPRTRHRQRALGGMGQNIARWIQVSLLYKYRSFVLALQSMHAPSMPQMCGKHAQEDWEGVVVMVV